MKKEEKNPMKRFFMNRTLKFRITLLYSLFAVLLVGLITFYTYRFTVRLLKEKETSILNDSLAYMENRISVRISSINEEYMNNFNSVKFLDLYLKDTYQNGDFLQHNTLSNEYNDYFFDMRIRNSDLLKSIMLVTANQEVYSDSCSPEFNYSQFLLSPYYPKAMKHKNKILYCNLEPDKNYVTILRSFYFTADKDRDSTLPTAGYHSNNEEDYSTLVFFLKKDYFQNIIREEARKRRTGVLILDNDGGIVVKDGELDWITESEITYLAEAVKGKSLGNFEDRLDEIHAGIHFRSIEYMDWKVFYIYDMNILYKEAAQIRNIVLYIFLFAVPAVFLIASVVSHSVVKPIRLLGKSMDEVVDNNMEVTFHPKYNDEIADLSKTFHVLMKRISVLMEEMKGIEEQKRAEELKALQAQINPHFLYNTLDTVYWLAKLDRNDNIADLISDLAGFFRLSLNKGEDITTVEREAEHVAKYLKIQKVRLNNRFDYEIHMDSACKEYRIPKLLLQPFAENSLLHGFGGISYHGRIVITVSKERDILIFSITDNGKGIAPEMIKRLNKKEKLRREELGYAIRNVDERIRLYGGEGYGVCFDEDYKEGTRVWIRFPLMFKG